LIRDEAGGRSLLAWEQEYLGMEISGTIHNEVRINGPLDLPDPDRTANGASYRVGQQASPAVVVEQSPSTDGLLARTARRMTRPASSNTPRAYCGGPTSAAAAPKSVLVPVLIGAEAIDMTGDSGGPIRPSPSTARCVNSAARAWRSSREPTPRQFWRKVFAVNRPRTWPTKTGTVEVGLWQRGRAALKW